MRRMYLLSMFVVMVFLMNSAAGMNSNSSYVTKSGNTLGDDAIYVGEMVIDGDRITINAPNKEIGINVCKGEYRFKVHYEMTERSSDPFEEWYFRIALYNWVGTMEYSTSKKIKDEWFKGQHEEGDLYLPDLSKPPLKLIDLMEHGCNEGENYIKLYCYHKKTTGKKSDDKWIDFNFSPPKPAEIIPSKSTVKVNKFVKFWIKGEIDCEKDWPATIYIDYDGDMIADEYKQADEGLINDGWYNVEFSHSYSSTGTYAIRAQAADKYGIKSDWSDPIYIKVKKDDHSVGNTKDTHNYSNIISSTKLRYFTKPINKNLIVGMEKIFMNLKSNRLMNIFKFRSFQSRSIGEISGNKSTKKHASITSQVIIIQGYVRTKSNAPIALANIVVDDDNSHYFITVTGLDGHYLISIPLLSIGEHLKITASKSGFKSMTKIIDRQPGDIIINVDFILEKSGSGRYISNNNLRVS